MKRRVFAFVAALAASSALSVGAVGAPAASGPSSVMWTQCQIDHYHRCMVIFGDHGYCFEQTEMTVC